MGSATLRKNFLLFFLAFIFLAFNSCQEPTSQTVIKYQDISGVILDEQEVPVPNANVQAVNSSNAVIDTATTNEDGAFTLSKVPEDFGSLKLRVIHHDFKLFEDNFPTILKDHDRKSLPVRLLHDDTCKGRIEITVKKKSDETAIANAEVRLNRGGIIIRKAKTNADGKLVFENICNGNYNIRISRENFKVIEKEFNFTNADSKSETFFMEDNNQSDCCNGVIIFNAKDASNNSLNEVTINLLKNGQKISEVKTNNEGKYIFTQIFKGDYTISYSKTGYIGGEFHLNSNCDTLTFNKIMTTDEDTCCKGKVILNLKDSTTNNALSGIIVKLRKGGTIVQTKTTDNNGRIAFENVCDGEYNLYISKDGYNTIEYHFSLDCNKTIEIQKKMISSICCNGVLVLTVKDHDGRALNEVIVKLWKSGQVNGDGKTNNEGKYIFTGLCKGSYSISYLKSNYKGGEFQFNSNCDTIYITKEMTIENTDTCCKGKIIVNLKDSASNAALSNTVVKLRIGATVQKTSTTDGNGKAVFENVCANDYNIYVEKDGYKALEYSFKLECNKYIEISKKLAAQTCCTAVLKIKVLDDSTETALQDAKVEVRLNDQTLSDPRTNAEGWITVEQLCAPKTYVIRISKTGYETKTLTFTYTGCTTKQETIKLKKI